MIAKILIVLGLILSSAFVGLSYYGKTVEVDSTKAQTESVKIEKQETKEEVLPSKETNQLKENESREPVVEEAIELGKELDVKKEDLEPVSDAELNDLETEILEEDIDGKE